MFPGAPETLALNHNFKVSEAPRGLPRGASLSGYGHRPGMPSVLSTIAFLAKAEVPIAKIIGTKEER